jgi:hypothetical protein
MVGKSIIAEPVCMVHNHGSRGTWLEFDRVIIADRASSSSPHGRRLDAVPSMVGKSIIAEPGHVSKHWMKVCRPDG